MSSNVPGFRDSLLVRLGMGILAAGIGGFVSLAIAGLLGYEFSVGPMGILLFLWIVVGLISIATGAGQTLIRRRARKAEEK